MEKYVIVGGNKVSDKVKVESAKNAVLPILAGSILINGVSVIENCPNIGDVN